MEGMGLLARKAGQLGVETVGSRCTDLSRGRGSFHCRGEAGWSLQAIGIELEALVN